ncbi:MAG: hypothetical protein AAFR62_12815 [Cyanobacteria bacterium J06629_2]
MAIALSFEKPESNSTISTPVINNSTKAIFLDIFSILNLYAAAVIAINRLATIIPIKQKESKDNTAFELTIPEAKLES